MWQRFTESARKVIFYSQEEAQRFGDCVVEPEHILLGLTREGGCVASKILIQLGASANVVYRDLSAQLIRKKERTRADMSLTPRSKAVIDLAYEEARNLHHNYIGTEHLLLGLLRQGDGAAGDILKKKGVNLNAARNELLSLVGRGSKPVSAPQSAPTRDSSDSDKAATVLAATRQRMGADQLCLMFLYEPGGYAEKAVVGCGVDIESVAQFAEREFLGLKSPEQVVARPLNASGLMELAIVEANNLGQFMNSSHFLLAAHKHGNNATARALSALRVSVDTLRDWVSAHP